MIIVWTAGIFFILFILVESFARLYHRFRFKIPFHSRVMGEYPYSQFVEQTDPPLFYRFKKGFRSPMIHINRFRCRGEEPAEDGQKKRIMLIGESMYFGVKLRHEKELWSCRLEHLLKEHGYSNWEVINAGNPMYNSVQHRLLWEQDLCRAKPDILLINMGGNDVTQAWMMGAQWEPGAPWPWNFITALERKSPWWNKFLSRFCFYFLLRRSITARRPFSRQDEIFKWEQCLKTIHENFISIAEDAEKAGAKVGFISFAPASDKAPRSEDHPKLEAIQSNWKTFAEGSFPYVYQMNDSFREDVCPQYGCPYIDLMKVFHACPNRYELFFDIGHWNAGGMRVVSNTIFEELENLRWLERGKK